jgi:peptidoglycan/LPS O-acetylase OafA/YrhL/lysophospholipase L1-like esterase
MRIKPTRTGDRPTRIPSIDGLRAIALILVVLFHFELSSFQNGYLGVDVFFVISGFVITNLLAVSDLKKSNASIFMAFYRNRFLRLAPSAVLVLVISTLFSKFWLAPSDFMHFLKSAISSLLFGANIFFTNSTNYFQTNQYSPLLHFWSLSVEEQFYFIYPLIFIGFLRLKLNKRILIPMIFIFSMTISIVLGFSLRTSHPNETFYLLPFRLWELLLGALVAIIDLQKVQKKVKASNTLFGLGSMILGIALIRKDTSQIFPSISALLACFATSLILISSTSTLARRFLGSRFLVFAGLRSYTAYLWHLPIIILINYRFYYLEEQVKLILFLGIIIITTIITYKFWETPWRSVSFSNIKLVGMYSLAVLGFLYLTLNQGGYRQELSLGDKNKILSFSDQVNIKVDRNGTCFVDLGQEFQTFSSSCDPAIPKDSITLIGDSHAGFFAPGLRNAGVNLGQYTSSACPPFIDIVRPDRPNCNPVNVDTMRRIIANPPEKILIMANWLAYGNEYGEENFKKNLENTIRYLRYNRVSSKIIFIGGLPQWEPNLPYLIAQQSSQLSVNARIKNRTIESVIRYDSILRDIAAAENAFFVSSTHALCDVKQMCVGIVESAEKEFHPLVFDYAHLTPAGAYFLAKRILPKIESSGS